MPGYMYILECSDGSYYTGSTKDMELRLDQHYAGEGANHTKKRLPVRLVYFEEFERIDDAFYREKQVQKWSRKKKEALINNLPEGLKKLAECMNESHFRNYKGGFDSAQPPLNDSAQLPLNNSAQLPLNNSAQPTLNDSAQLPLNDSINQPLDNSAQPTTR